jgi:hypothetical protein
MVQNLLTSYYSTIYPQPGHEGKKQLSCLTEWKMYETTKKETDGIINYVKMSVQLSSLPLWIS